MSSPTDLERQLTRLADRFAAASEQQLDLDDAWARFDAQTAPGPLVSAAPPADSASHASPLEADQPAASQRGPWLVWAAAASLVVLATVVGVFNSRRANDDVAIGTTTIAKSDRPEPSRVWIGADAVVVADSAITTGLSADFNEGSIELATTDEAWDTMRSNRPNLAADGGLTVDFDDEIVALVAVGVAPECIVSTSAAIDPRTELGTPVSPQVVILVKADPTCVQSDSAPAATLVTMRIPRAELGQQFLVTADLDGDRSLDGDVDETSGPTLWATGSDREPQQAGYIGVEQ